MVRAATFQKSHGLGSIDEIDRAVSVPSDRGQPVSVSDEESKRPPIIKREEFKNRKDSEDDEEIKGQQDLNSSFGNPYKNDYLQPNPKIKILPCQESSAKLSILKSLHKSSVKDFSELREEELAHFGLDQIPNEIDSQLFAKRSQSS